MSQNIDGVTRSPNFCYKWDQTDEGYYRAEAKKGLPEFIASTRENYYCIPDVSIYRGRFICPKNEKTLFQGSGAIEHVNSSASYGDDYVPYWYDDENWAPPTPEWKKGDILLYVHPKTGQAEFYCPRCSVKEGKPVKHIVHRELRDQLAEDGVIPIKEYKYKNRTLEVDTIMGLVTSSPGISLYRLNREAGWPKGTAERLIKNHLDGKIRVRKGKKGYRVYLA